MRSIQCKTERFSTISQQNLSWQDILDLVEKLDGSDFAPVHLEYPGVTLQLSRESSSVQQVSAPSTATVSASGTSTPAPSPAPSNSTEPHDDVSVSGTTIDAPMVGVFYAAPSPGADAFVAVGDTVSPDSTVGIVEVMKLMNPITAGVSGSISKVLVSDGEQVEFGQPLFVIEEN